ARHARIYTMNQYLSAVRVDEFKHAITAELRSSSSSAYAGIRATGLRPDTGLPRHREVSRQRLTLRYVKVARQACSLICALISAAAPRLTSIPVNSSGFGQFQGIARRFGKETRDSNPYISATGCGS